MKSAYELAMERLNQESPSRTLTKDEKAEMAEMENKFDAKIAELNLAHNTRVATLDPMSAMASQQELVFEVA
jgi:predicted ATPase